MVHKAVNRIPALPFSLPLFRILMARQFESQLQGHHVGQQRYSLNETDSHVQGFCYISGQAQVDINEIHCACCSMPVHADPDLPDMVVVLSPCRELLAQSGNTSEPFTACVICVSSTPGSLIGGSLNELDRPANPDLTPDAAIHLPVWPHAETTMHAAACYRNQHRCTAVSQPPLSCPSSHSNHCGGLYGSRSSCSSRRTLCHRRSTPRTCMT